ncbi:hypothetical protein SNEBB_008566 [Seison nebaliae]|nr:hypothetical protein SNEBB_008566 [Seison nebaliae]
MFYMDDAIIQGENLEERDEIFQKITVLLSRYGFSWGKSRNEQELRETKVLGIIWTEDDHLQIKTPEFSNINTKRQLLHTIASIYDPIGIMNPFVTRGKSMIRKLWIEKYKWDEIIDEDNRKEILQFMMDVQNFSNILISRKVNINEGRNLHCFTDASQHAKACTIYLVGKDVRFIRSKSKLTNPKSTIQRSELDGILFGINEVKKICEIEKFNKLRLFLWSDSKDNIQRIINGKEHKDAYIRKRVDTIRMSNITLKYCPSELNFADLPSRGITRPKHQIEKWVSVPQWLLTENDCPSQNFVERISTQHLSVQVTQTDKPEENETPETA